MKFHRHARHRLRFTSASQFNQWKIETRKFLHLRSLSSIFLLRLAKKRWKMSNVEDWRTPEKDETVKRTDHLFERIINGCCHWLLTEWAGHWWNLRMLDARRPVWRESESHHEIGELDIFSIMKGFASGKEEWHANWSETMRHTQKKIYSRKIRAESGNIVRVESGKYFILKLSVLLLSFMMMMKIAISKKGRES